MKYTLKTIEKESLLILSIEGDVEYDSLLLAIGAAEGVLSVNAHLHLLIDGMRITQFSIPNNICQQMASKLFGQSRRSAFFSSSPLAFGMARVIQTYSFNEHFAVFKEYHAAKQFVTEGSSTSAPSTIS